MVSREMAIAIGILVLVGLGFYFISNMTGNAITGLSVAGNDVKMKIENEYSKISDFGEGEREVENNGESSSGSE